MLSSVFFYASLMALAGSAAAYKDVIDIDYGCYLDVNCTNSDGNPYDAQFDCSGTVSEGTVVSKTIETPLWN